MAWDDAKRAKAIELYTDKNPTAENSSEILAEVAAAVGETVNGTRMILSKAEVYVKKEPGKPAGGTKAKEGATGGTRVNKEEAQNALIELLEGEGLEVDKEIISKMTGKAAVHFTELFKKFI